MTFAIRSLLAVGFWLCALPAWGQSANDWTNCDGNTPATLNRSIGPGKVICLEFDEDWLTTGTGATAGFNVGSREFSVALQRDVASTGGSAAIQVQWCVQGSTPSANTCATIDTISDETPKAYTRGFYRINVSSAVTAGQDAKVEIRGY